MRNLVIALIVIFILYILFKPKKDLKPKTAATSYEAGYNAPDTAKVIKKISKQPYEGGY